LRDEEIRTGKRDLGHQVVVVVLVLGVDGTSTVSRGLRGFDLLFPQEDEVSFLGLLEVLLNAEIGLGVVGVEILQLLNEVSTDGAVAEKSKRGEGGRR